MCSQLRTNVFSYRNMNLKICSSNIRFDNPKDGTHDWAGRRQILSNFLNSINFDLLGTQEGLRPQIEDLLSLVGNLNLSDKHRDWIIDRMYPSIFFNPHKLTVIDSGDIWLSETPHIPASKSFGSAFPRLCTWAKFSNDLIHINVHLDHLQTNTRQEQIKVLSHEIKKINNCKYTILTGDFNEGPQEEVMKIIVSELGLYDPWQSLNNPEEASHHDFSGASEGGLRIDWILLSKNISCEKIQLYKGSVNEIYPSDHYPVFAEVTLK